MVISADAIEDTAGTPNAFPGTGRGQWTFSTAAQDLTAPVITLKSPVDNAADVSRATNIVATFDDNILAGTRQHRPQGPRRRLDHPDHRRHRRLAGHASSGKVLTIDPAVSPGGGHGTTPCRSPPER